MPDVSTTIRLSNLLAGAMHFNGAAFPRTFPLTGERNASLAFPP